MVKPGYKQTEVGVVPKEWSVMTLRDIADFWGGGTPSKSIAEYWNGDIPWISSSDISLNSVHGLNITRYITGQAVKESSTQLCPRNAILIVTRVGVGKIAIAPTNICTSQDFTNIVLRQDNVEYVARALQPVFYCMSNETQGKMMPAGRAIICPDNEKSYILGSDVVKVVPNSSVDSRYLARQRFNLTKRLSQITQAKVVAVGDDWQSIYAFSGSDITLFTRFLELMGAGTELKITHTYRNSQELIDIAGGFVQRNTSQIRKQLISPKHLENPIVLEVFDDSVKPMERLADTIEHIIGEILSEYGEQSSILLIGRYNYDMYKLYRTNRFSELPGGAIRSEKYPNAKITFMTAHSSKGLGYDNVILINMFEGKFGFPCQIEDDPIIKLVTYEDNSMPFAEERRLFYVAMTRTKNRVYIAAPKTKPSRFLVELIKDFNIPHDDELNMQVVDLFNLRCPVCGFPLKYEFNKNYGLNLWICTNEAELCDFMTNDRTHMHDILKCPKCTDGYLIVKKNPKNGDIFYGCTNYLNEEKKCTYMVPLESGHMKDD